MGVTGMTVGKWRKRYREFGIEGLHDELRPGRPRTYEDDKVAEVINRALQTKPSDGSTQWSARSLAAETGISKSTVHRWLKTFSLQPHLQKTFKISTDPFFVEKVRDIVGLYLNPPDKAMVLCVDPQRRWRDGKAVDGGKPIPTGQGWVRSLIELKNGELISGGGDGSLRRFSLPALAKAACSELDLANDPDTLESPAGRAALDTTKKLGTYYLKAVK